MKGYKVVATIATDARQQDVYQSIFARGTCCREYEEGVWTEVGSGCGPLAVFTTLGAAVALVEYLGWRDRANYDCSTIYTVFECEYIPSPHPYMYMAGATFPPDKETILAARVMILSAVSRRG